MNGYLLITGLIFLIVGLRALLRPLEAVAVPHQLRVDGVNGNWPAGRGRKIKSPGPLSGSRRSCPHEADLPPATYP